METFKEVWASLGEITVDEDGNIDVPWRGFEVGTPREDIWSALEDQYNVSVGKVMSGD